MERTAHLVFLRSGAVVLTKRPFDGWRDVQEAYDGYLTSLGPWTEDEIAAYFEHDYPGDADAPFPRDALRAFFASYAAELRTDGRSAP